jgi:hypothetical protein
MDTVLIEYDISLVHGAIEDVDEDIFQRYRVNKEELYEKVEKEVKEIQQSIQFIHAAPTAPSSSQIAEVRDKPTQLS